MAPRFAVHLLQDAVEGVANPHIVKMLAGTDSFWRAEHLASEYARCHPEAHVMLLDRTNMLTEQQRVYHRGSSYRVTWSLM